MPKISKLIQTSSFKFRSLEAQGLAAIIIAPACAVAIVACAINAFLWMAQSQPLTNTDHTRHTETTVQAGEPMAVPGDDFTKD